MTLPASSRTFSSELELTSSAYRITPLVTEPVGIVPLINVTLPTVLAPVDPPLTIKLAFASILAAFTLPPGLNKRSTAHSIKRFKY